MDKNDATVKCDEKDCGWSKTIPRKNISKWHKVPCPKCCKGQIVNDADLVAFRMVLALESVSKEIDPEGKASCMIHFDTASLRR